MSCSVITTILSGHFVLAHFINKICSSVYTNETISFSNFIGCDISVLVTEKYPDISEFVRYFINLILLLPIQYLKIIFCCLVFLLVFGGMFLVFSLLLIFILIIINMPCIVLFSIKMGIESESN